MTDKIVSLADKRLELRPHYAGKAYCVGCHHEWVAVAPIGTMTLDCPACGLPKGTPKFPFGPDEADASLRCTPCGGEALFAYKHHGDTYVRCMGCGNDLTDALYEG